MLSGQFSDDALRATGISFVAIAVAVLGAALAPEAREQEILLWVLAVIPAFLLAYHRGWRGIATVLAAAMAALTVVQAGAAWAGADLVTHGPVLRILLVALGTTAGIGVLAELAQRARVQADRLEMTDPVTSLPNGRHAALVLDRELAGAARGRPLTVVAFQIDNITTYQWRHGRANADAVRRTFASVLRKQTRRMNFSAHDGDRFVTILSSSDVGGGRAFVAKVQSAFTAAVGPTLKLTASAGVAAYDASMADRSSLMRAVDFVLSQAQHDGAGSVRVHQPPERARKAEDLLTSIGRLREKTL
jgi:diguanylate cyclase (GGDEF)-like protein